MTHQWFDAESKKELKKLQMSNPNAETQNLSTHFASSSDTDPQRWWWWWWVMGAGGGGCPWSGCVLLCISLMLAQLSHGAVWMSAVWCPHTFARVQRARLIYDSLTLWSSSVSQLKLLVSSTSAVTTVCDWRRAPSASGRSSHHTITCEVEVTHVTLLGNCMTNIWPATCKKQPQKNPFVFMFCSLFISFPSHWGLHLGPCKALGSQDRPSEGQDINHRWRLAEIGLCSELFLQFIIHRAPHLHSKTIAGKRHTHTHIKHTAFETRFSTTRKPSGIEQIVTSSVDARGPKRPQLLFRQSLCPEKNSLCFVCFPKRNIWTSVVFLRATMLG